METPDEPTNPPPPTKPKRPRRVTPKKTTVIVAAPRIQLPADLVRARDLDPQRQDWLWSQIIPSGVLCLVTGAPGVSKSSLLIDIAARISKGTLDGDFEGRPQNVLYLSREDSAEKTLVPKLMAAGAWGPPKEGEGEVILLNPKREDSYAFPRDVTKLAQLIKQHQIGVVMLDSLMSFMDTKRSLHGNYQAAVESITPLAEMCVKAGVTLIGVMHLKKDADTAGLNSIIGSVGLGATARHVVMIGSVAMSDHRIVGVIKSNLGPELVGQVYEVTWPVVAIDPATQERVRASQINVLRPATDDEVESMLEKRKKASNSAHQLLILSAIRDGASYMVSEILAKAPELNVVQRTLRRQMQGMASVGLVNETGGEEGKPLYYSITKRGQDMVDSLAPAAEADEVEEEEEPVVTRRNFRLVATSEDSA